MSRLHLVLAWLVLLSSPAAFAGDKAAFHPDTGAGCYPEYSALAAGPWQPRLLPGCHEFTFSMYGCPGNVDDLKQLVGVMQERGLGNGFDPGPAARASSRPLFEHLATVGWPMICYPGWSDMQVKDGRCRLRDEDEAALRVLDRAGVFSVIQLGEWGYYFHNLSWVESWWRDVYGKDFEAYRHLMQPPATVKTRQIPRRTFLRGVVPLPLILTAAARPSVPRRVKFGLVSDVHQDVMPDGLDRIRRFVTAMQEAGADFILQLGDFCWPHPRNKAFLAAWNAFAGARYHVLGNHDMDGGYQREQTVAYYGAPGRYYTFDAGPLRGIVLDSNDPGGKARGYRKFIAADQQAWLEDTLTRADRPVCVFLHHPLDEGGGIENGKVIRTILERAEAAHPGTVLAVFSGHFHQDYVLVNNGVRYVQINSASYVWLPEAAARETYPPEMHRAHPHLRNVAAYQDPLWALVTVDLDRGELVVEGTRSKWLGPDPWERGAPETDYPRGQCRPVISDRRFTLRQPR